MSKDYQRECKECDGPDMGSIFNKGDGRCRACHGSGVDEVKSVFNIDSSKDVCDVCNGTGQCQNCGGTGYEYYPADDALYERDSYSYASSGNDYSLPSGPESTGTGGKLYRYKTSSPQRLLLGHVRKPGAL